MNNNLKIIVSSIIAALVVSLLFLVIPITATFIVDHIFALIAIGGITASLCIYNQRLTKAPQGFGYIYAAGVYAAVSTVFSIIAYAADLDTLWAVVVHVALLAVFVIIAISISAGNKHITRLDDVAVEKHKAFEKEKANYWK